MSGFRRLCLSRWFIPPREMPVDAIRVTDPVTGATYLRPRPHPKKPDSSKDFNGGPLPSTCGTPYCTKAGLPHDECTGTRQPFDPYYFTPAANVPPLGTPSIDGSPLPFVPPRPEELEAHPGGDRSAFKRWIQSFPGWNMPLERPSDWHSAPDGDIHRAYRQYTPFHHASNLPQWPSAYSTHYTPRGHIQGLPTPMVHSMSPWSNASGMLNRAPDLIEWNDIQGGKLQWTPHPWVAHPLPHPGMSPQAFWDTRATNLHPWRGPGGWSATYGQDAERSDMLTGGHPLPGMDPYWTPSTWVPPLYPPRMGVWLSPFLAANPRDASVPHILWDAAVEPPYRIRRITSRGAIVDFAGSDHFKAQATYPGVKTLQVYLPGMKNTWGPVLVKKDEPIKVGDIFNAVWEYLHKPLTQAEWNSLIATYGQKRKESITYAFHRRCLTAAGLYEYVRSQGLKRVDLLEGNTVYWGTYLVYNMDGTWALAMAFLPRSRTYF